MVQLVYPDPFGSFLKGLRQAEEDNRKDMMLLDRLYRTYLMEQRQKAKAAAAAASATYDTASLSDDIYKNMFDEGDDNTGEKQTLDQTAADEQQDTTPTEGVVEPPQVTPPPVRVEPDTADMPLLPSTPKSELPTPVPPPPVAEQNGALTKGVGAPKIQDRILPDATTGLTYQKDQTRILPDAGPGVPSSPSLSPQPPTTPGPAAYFGKFPFEQQFAAKVELGGTPLAERAATINMPPPPAAPPPPPQFKTGMDNPLAQYVNRMDGGDKAYLNERTGKVINKSQARIPPRDAAERAAQIYRELYSLQIANLQDTQRYKQLLAEYDALNRILAGGQ